MLSPTHEISDRLVGFENLQRPARPNPASFATDAHDPRELAKKTGRELAGSNGMSRLQRDPTVDRILGCAVRVHQALGPGLLESTYERCLAYEFSLAEIGFRRQVSLPVMYRGHRIDCGYRVDFIVEDHVLVELKAVEHLLPLHSAQAITYLKLTGLPRALLLNFNVRLLREGMKSFLRPEASRSQG